MVDFTRPPWRRSPSETRNHIERALTPDGEKQASLRLGRASCDWEIGSPSDSVAARLERGHGASIEVYEEQAVTSNRIAIASRWPRCQIVRVELLQGAPSLPSAFEAR
jgi:hypothetical protein